MDNDWGTYPYDFGNLHFGLFVRFPGRKNLTTSINITYIWKTNTISKQKYLYFLPPPPPKKKKNSWFFSWEDVVRIFFVAMKFGPVTTQI